MEVQEDEEISKQNVSNIENKSIQRKSLKIISIENVNVDYNKFGIQPIKYLTKFNPSTDNKECTDEKPSVNKSHIETVNNSTNTSNSLENSTKTYKITETSDKNNVINKLSHDLIQSEFMSKPDHGGNTTKVDKNKPSSTYKGNFILKTLTVYLGKRCQVKKPFISHVQNSSEDDTREKSNYRAKDYKSDNDTNTENHYETKSCKVIPSQSKRKRGRPRKALTNEANTSIPKSRYEVRTSKNEDITSTDDNSSEYDSTDEDFRVSHISSNKQTRKRTKPNVRRGRPKKTQKVHSPKHSKKSHTIKCGKCNLEMKESQWLRHNINKHNGMAWQHGQTEPDFSSTKLLQKVLQNACNQLGMLKCETCTAVKKSACGFISHLQVCGKDREEKKKCLVACEICNRTMLPLSLQMHMREHRKKLANQVKEETNTSNTKRKAAKKARNEISKLADKKPDSFKKVQEKVKRNISNLLLSRWKIAESNNAELRCNQPGCQFVCRRFEEMIDHRNQCEYSSQMYHVCKVCDFRTQDEFMCMKHIFEEHEEDKSVAEQCKGSFKLSKKVNQTDDTLDSNRLANRKKFKFVDYESKYNELYLPSTKLTIKFEIRNYSLRLFDEFKPNLFRVMHEDEYYQYIPLTDISMSTATTDEPVSHSKLHWKKWKRFEGGIVNDSPVFFTGGPVWAMAWLPIPAPMILEDTPSQFLAISTHQSMNDEFNIGQSHSGQNIIQFWNLGHLKNYSKIVQIPKLSFAIAHDFGTCWSLEWCPSGCYRDKELSQRMGLLAAGCSDGKVYIFDIPHPKNLPIAELRNQLPIFKTEPIITLIVNKVLKDERKWQCTKICWTKEKGHDVIAAGLSNGYIALWDLQTESPLSRSKEKNSIVIMPFQCFFGHHHAVTMVALVPYGNKRFLATAGLDKYFKCWDLEDTSQPISLEKKGLATDGAWVTNWGCALIGYDDSLLMGHTYSYLISAREYTYKSLNVMATNSATYSVAVCDYSNGLAHGTAAGEIIVVFPHELIGYRDIEKIYPRMRHLSSSIQVIDFEQSINVTEDETDDNYYLDKYDDCKDRFGIVFTDKDYKYIRGNYARSKCNVISCEKMKSNEIRRYPFSSVNRVTWNPNTWSYLYLAAGYQNGLVRLQNFKSVPSSKEVSKLLKSHCNNFLRKGNETFNT